MKISEEAFIHSYEPQLFKHLQKVHFPENSRNDSIGQEFPSVDSKVNFGILIHFHCVGNCVPLLIRICTLGWEPAYTSHHLSHVLIIWF